MATQQLTIVRDDLTGEEIPPGHGKTVRLVLGSEAWELDLSPESYRKVREMLDPVVGDARKARPAKQAQHRVPARIDREQRRATRVWWKANYRKAGLPEPTDMGRIPEMVAEAYQRHGGTKVE